MKYKGMEVIEADGKDYPLSTEPKEMLVWYGDNCKMEVKEVLGYYRGRWIANHTTGIGVSEWEYAAEIPRQKTIVEWSNEIYDKTKYYPYIVCHNDRQFTEQENQCAIRVCERSLLTFLKELRCPNYTFVVLPECCDLVKDMFSHIVDDNDPMHAKILLLSDKEA